MWRFIGLGIVIIIVAGLGFSLIDVSTGEISADVVIEFPETDTSQFAQAIDPWDWQFPRDHGAHPKFQTEWWYYTGNLADEDGRRFGFQFTVFRRAIQPLTIASDSEWRSRQVYMAHFTVSDPDNENFYHSERYSRGGAGLAGAEGEPTYRVWLEDWEVMATNEDATQLKMNATTQDVAIDFTLEQTKPPAFQGENGLSSKSAEVGNASYYYSLTRLLTEGTLTIDDMRYEVTGLTWMDHEFSTSALGADAQGWDWFGLIFDEGYELMVGQIRNIDDSHSPIFGGLLVYPDGNTLYLPADTFTIEAINTWRSPHTDAVYPSGWTITIDGARLDQNNDIELRVIPLAEDQELNTGDIAYWEGAVQVEGSFNGYGYAELTGYTDAMTGRF